jgi:hypothetical protein
VIELHFILLEVHELVNFCFHVCAVIASHVVLFIGARKSCSSFDLNRSIFSQFSLAAGARLSRRNHVTWYLEPREVARPLSNGMARFKSHFRRESDEIMLLVRSVDSTDMTVSTQGDALDGVAFRNVKSRLKQS